MVYAVKAGGAENLSSAGICLPAPHSFPWTRWGGFVIHIVVGPPCAGKSTYVKERATEGDVIVDFDGIARALGASGHMPEGAAKDVAFAARAAAIDALLKGAEAASWIIHTSPSAEQVDAYRGAAAEFIVLDPDMEECLVRAESDERPAGTVEAIRSWYESPPDIEATSLEPPKGRFFYARKEG
jgi:predicted kinase